MQTPPIVEHSLACHHCGDACPDDHIHLGDDKHFCCQGCKTVYEILSANGLCTYYNLSDNAGISLKGRDYGDKYAYLDNPAIGRHLLDYADEETARVTFYIPAMHCSSCIWLLENLFKLRDGIGASRVNFLKKEIALAFDPAVLSLRELVELLATLGYEPHLSLEAYGKPAAKKTGRGILLKLGVVGFCTGNSMILSFPEYLGLEGVVVDGPFKHLFVVVNALLSLPLFFYGAGEYLSAAWRSVRERVISLDVPLAVGIGTLFGRSWYEILTATGPGYFDSLAGLVFFLLVGKWVQGRTYEHLYFERSYESYFPLAVTVVREGNPESIPVADVQPGDHLLIRNGELIPADGNLLSPEAAIDYSFVTGESEPVTRKAGEYLYAGGRQTGGSIELLVQKPVSQSYLTGLWNNDAFRKEKAVPVTRLASGFSRYFTFVTLLVAAGAAAYWCFADRTVLWNAVTAVLIVACPCALSLSMPFTMGTVMNIFGRNKFYVKSPDVIQHLAAVSGVVFDKTGTLTESREVTATFSGTPLTDAERGWVKSLAAQSTHPLSRAVCAALPGVPAEATTGFRELPGQGLEAVVDGRAIQLGSATYLGVRDEGQPRKSVVYLAVDGVVRGHFRVANRYRQGLETLVARLRRHYGLFLLSGDRPTEKNRLLPYFASEDHLRFNQSPADKLHFVQGLQARGERVLMVGDGLNDAGALRQSEVGVAITEDVNAFFPASDALLDAAQFSRLPDFLRFSRTALNMVKASFLLSVVYNVIGLSWAVSGNLSPVFAAVFMPLSSLSVVVFANVGTRLLARKARL
jgi:Cu+-exporting ATPase